jgi:hypothetical protein
MDQAELAAYRPWLSYADVLPGSDDFRYTFVGHRIVQYFIFDATGFTVREAFGAALVGRTTIGGVLWIFQKASLSRRPVRVEGKGTEWRGLVFRDYDALYLPLSEKGIVANSVMCAFTYKELSA